VCITHVVTLHATCMPLEIIYVPSLGSCATTVLNASPSYPL
jgi:hypothetical protein